MGRLDEVCALLRREERMLAFADMRVNRSKQQIVAQLHGDGMRYCPGFPGYDSWAAGMPPDKESKEGERGIRRAEKLLQLSQKLLTADPSFPMDDFYERLEAAYGAEGDSSMSEEEITLLDSYKLTLHADLVAKAPSAHAEKVVKDRMALLAKELPVHDWWVAQRGFAANGLARIIANTGNLSMYSGPDKVKARLGLHLFQLPGGRGFAAPSTIRRRGLFDRFSKEDAEEIMERFKVWRQRQIAEGADPSEFDQKAIDETAKIESEKGLPRRRDGARLTPRSAAFMMMQYPQKRRAIVYTVTDAALKTKGGSPAKTLYDQYKAEMIQKRTDAGEFGPQEDWTQGRCHMHAHRRVSQKIMVDMWRVWHGLPPVLFHMDGGLIETPTTAVESDLAG